MLAGNHGSFNFLLYRWRSDSDFPCALRDSREPQKTHTEENTHRKRRDEDEAAFENQRRACRGVLRAGFFLDGHACGGGSGRLLPHRYFRNARLRLYQPGAMPGDGFRPRLKLLRESIPGGRQRRRQRERQRQSEQQRLCLSAEAPCFEGRKEAGSAPIEPRAPTEGEGWPGLAPGHYAAGCRAHCCFSQNDSRPCDAEPPITQGMPTAT